MEGHLGPRSWKVAEAPNDALKLPKRNCMRNNGCVTSFAFRNLTRC